MRWQHVEASVVSFRAMAADAFMSKRWGGAPACSPRDVARSFVEVEALPSPRERKLANGLRRNGSYGKWRLRGFVKASTSIVRIHRSEFQIRVFSSARLTDKFSYGQVNLQGKRIPLQHPPAFATNLRDINEPA